MHRQLFRLALLLVLVVASRARAEESIPGLRVYTAGHSFHVFVSPLLNEIAREPAVVNHRNAGMQFIGGSRVIQHWNLPDDKNKAKVLLGKGEIDVLTISPVLMPDDGIDKFVALGLEHNEDLRVTVQANWLPWDVYDPPRQLQPHPVDFDAATVESLEKTHQEYFASIDEKVRAVNKSVGKEVVRLVPVGKAVIALRGKVLAGEMPKIEQQSELFADKMGHPKVHIMLLNAYCHYTVIYGHSPVGLPVPACIANVKYEPEKLNRLLQEIAWEAVTGNPQSGVKQEEAVEASVAE